MKFENVGLTGQLPNEWANMNGTLQLLQIRDESGITGTIPSLYGKFQDYENFYMDLCLRSDALSGSTIPNRWKLLKSGKCFVGTWCGALQTIGVCWDDPKPTTEQNTCGVTANTACGTPKPTPAPPTPAPTPNCAAGRFLDVATNDCTQCSKGKYQDQPGQTSCALCPTGKYQDHVEESACKTCTTNTRFQGRKTCNPPTCRTCNACVNCKAPNYAFDSVITYHSDCSNDALPVCDDVYFSGSTAICALHDAEANTVNPELAELTHENCKYFVNINSGTCATHNPPYEDIPFYRMSECNVDKHGPNHFNCSAMPFQPGHAACEFNNAQEQCTSCDNCVQESNPTSTCTQDAINPKPVCDAMLTVTSECKSTQNILRNSNECSGIRQDVGFTAPAGKLCGTISDGVHH